MKSVISFLLVLILWIGKSRAQMHCCAAEFTTDVQHLFPRLNDHETLQKLKFSIQNSIGTPQVKEIRVPVVFHIIISDPSTITMDLINSQIEVLNEDFSGKNPDISQVPDCFKKDLAGDTKIRFYLKDVKTRATPQTFIIGNLSSGKTRTEITDPIRTYSTGGLDAISPATILNIWVGNIKMSGEFGEEEELQGYALMPPAPLNLSGVVINARNFGRLYSVNNNYNLGRVCTHEVGHYFGLQHIFGDVSTCTDDNIDDTPIQYDANVVCRTGTYASCKNDGDMYMNYMDYTPDACKYMFTKGQAQKMHQVISAFYPFYLIWDKNAPWNLEMLQELIYVKNISQYQNKAVVEFSTSHPGDITDIYIRKLSDGSWQLHHTADSSFNAQGLEPGEIYEIKLKSGKNNEGFKDFPSTYFLTEAAKFTDGHQMEIN
ncbi:Pregnancy-associated plasma protein-A [Chitinophaga jiangningensis]|uniref:Pregnancy-associated plasma protein-A n=1 Tax=Chitinophaga jiangningensis TaxID=1419482 RepID=A0A1M7LBC2_9BACT|nr:M43 family zinc metalloprotease [Chitinophaga jiangningensis]SHM75143.1 Pregnancy-associated plasma protein-A [Chitinophaga jiangningensis]